MGAVLVAMKRLAAGLLALVACAPKVLPDDLRSILLGVAPISDEIVLVCSADHVTSVSAEGAILARTELPATSTPITGRHRSSPAKRSSSRRA
ncbi:MAG: hypothetical protein KC420_03080 [Myxococcales bacterium]|nr:hypothetical protein [Myxococcales bacterium]